MSGITIIAATLGLDLESSRAFNNEYRYQPTRHVAAIYTDGNDYYAVGKRRPKDVVGEDWTPWTDQFWAAKEGTTLWVSKTTK